MPRKKFDCEKKTRDLEERLEFIEIFLKAAGYMILAVSLLMVFIFITAIAAYATGIPLEDVSIWQAFGFCIIQMFGFLFFYSWVKTNW